MKEFEALDGSIDRSHLGKIERGEFVPELYTLYKIASLLEEDLSTFFVKDKKKED